MVMASRGCHIFVYQRPMTAITLPAARFPAGRCSTMIPEFKPIDYLGDAS
jgi:hypothetical protein